MFDSVQRNNDGADIKYKIHTEPPCRLNDELE